MGCDNCFDLAWCYLGYFLKILRILGISYILRNVWWMHIQWFWGIWLELDRYILSLSLWSGFFSPGINDKIILSCHCWQLIAEAHLCGLELFEKILSISSAAHMQSGLIEPILELSKHLLFAQKDIGLHYVPKLSSAMLTLFIILVQSELEHEQLSTLKLLHLLLKWKYGNGMLKFYFIYNLIISTFMQFCERCWCL